MTIDCTIAQCLPAYVLGGISLIWSAYHEYLIYIAKRPTNAPQSTISNAPTRSLRPISPGSPGSKDPSIVSPNENFILN